MYFKCLYFVNTRKNIKKVHYFTCWCIEAGFTFKAGKNYILREFSTKDDQVKDIKVVHL